MCTNVEVSLNVTVLSLLLLLVIATFFFFSSFFIPSLIFFFYIALFSALEQTRWAHVACDSE